MFLALLAFADGTLRAELMPRAAKSWEGEFHLEPTRIRLDADGWPPLQLCLYRLPVAAQGTAVGFADAQGAVLLKPRPTNRGVQPVYRGHAVFVASRGDVEIVIMYDVQGNGGLKAVEKYRYDGRSVALLQSSHYGGRHDPVWRTVDVEKPREGAGARAAH